MHIWISHIVNNTSVLDLILYFKVAVGVVVVVCACVFQFIGQPNRFTPPLARHGSSWRGQLLTYARPHVRLLGNHLVKPQRTDHTTPLYINARACVCVCVCVYARVCRPQECLALLWVALRSPRSTQSWGNNNSAAYARARILGCLLSSYNPLCV